MKLNVKNLVLSGTAGGVIGLALTMESEPELAGVLLGALLGATVLYANSIESEK